MVFTECADRGIRNNLHWRVTNSSVTKSGWNHTTMQTSDLLPSWMHQTRRQKRKLADRVSGNKILSYPEDCLLPSQCPRYDHSLYSNGVLLFATWPDTPVPAPVTQTEHGFCLSVHLWQWNSRSHPKLVEMRLSYRTSCHNRWPEIRSETRCQWDCRRGKVTWVMVLCGIFLLFELSLISHRPFHIITVSTYWRWFWNLLGFQAQLLADEITWCAYDEVGT